MPRSHSCNLSFLLLLLLLLLLLPLRTCEPAPFFR